MKLFIHFLSILFVTCFMHLASAQHAHLNAGADSNQPAPFNNPAVGSPLFFVNGSSFEASSGNFRTMNYSTTGTYAGTFNGGLTITSLPATVAFGGPSAYHAALGSYLVLGLESVSGPLGGTFSFWESGAVAPTLSLGSGVTLTEPLRFNLSEGLAEPGEDPFGHIHGRRFSADTAGSYLVTFRLFDLSTNGPGGGPIHSPSDPFTIRFDAIPEPSTWVLLLILLGIGGLTMLRKRNS